MNKLFNSQDFVTEKETSTTLGSPACIPDVVEGRVAHIDGDYLAYIVSADRVSQDKMSLPIAIKHLHEFVEQLMVMSGSTDYIVHLTSGDKGGRADQALLKEYQANRKDKEKPLLLGDVRRYIAENMKAFVCKTGEADDSMAMMLHLCRVGGVEEKAVLISQDKDLRMVQGWHLDWITQELFYVDAVGGLTVKVKAGKDGKITKSVKGTGGMWFFAQLLIGDTADNISGLPQMVGSILNDIAPTEAIKKARAVLDDPKASDKRRLNAQKTLASRKAGNCGQMKAYDYLKDCKTLTEAYTKVYRAYKLYAEEIGFKDYHGNDITLQQAFDSECQLLYMRHNLLPDDFKSYIQRIIREKL